MTESNPKARAGQKITPYLWFDHQAEEAARFYASIFGDSTVGKVGRYPAEGQEIHGQPEGSVMTVNFRLEGLPFTAINGGPHFTFTPATSFFVTCKTPEDVDALWEKLSEGGTVLMDLDSYPFSEKYGWVEDTFGVSWQLSAGGESQEITPFLSFVGDQFGNAEEAVNFYTSVFPDSGTIVMARYDAGGEQPEGAVSHAQFVLNGQPFMAMESGLDHDFAFNEAISFLVTCETQAEVDYYWETLSADPKAEQCGWLKDPFGVSWQIVPTALGELLADPDREKSGRVWEAMLQMKKINISDLRQAYEGR